MTRPLARVAAGAILFSALLAAWEGFAPHSHPAGEPAGAEDDALLEFLVVLGIVLVAAVAVFGGIVRHGLRRESAVWIALGLSVLGILSVAAFWSGLPPILAGGGILLGWASREAARFRPVAWVAVGLGAFALVADVAIYITDMYA